MNVIHLQNLGGIGGIAVLTRDIAMKSKEKNYFYFVFEGGDIAEQIKEYSPVFVAEGSHKRIFKEAKRFYAYCKNNNADVIIEHTGTAIGLTCALYAKRRLKNARLILYWHSNASFFDKKGVKGNVEVFLKRLAYKKCNAVAAISNSVKSSYLKVYGYKKDKISVVYNGINTSKFFSSRLDCCGKLPLNIIYVGRVFKPKGIHLLIGAINLMDGETKQKIRVKIVGQDRGDYTERMIKKTAELGLDGIIEFTGARLDVPELLAGADLFIHPAICEEGFGITLAEAMASYVPCLAFRLGAIPEVIDENKNGFIVDDISIEGLKEAIINALDIYENSPALYLEMRNCARKKAETFSIENTLTTLESLYKE